jgi:hypothetical protein
VNLGAARTRVTPSSSEARLAGADPLDIPAPNASLQRKKSFAWVLSLWYRLPSACPVFILSELQIFCAGVVALNHQSKEQVHD